MPSKPVVQNTCERCTRVWYTEKAVEVKLELRAELSGEKFEATFGCLCDGCSKTVASLLKSITKDFTKPRAPRAKKKEESADKGKPPSTDPPVTPDVSPAMAHSQTRAPHVDGASPASSAASSSGAGGQRPIPTTAASPRPR